MVGGTIGGTVDGTVGAESPAIAQYNTTSIMSIVTASKVGIIHHLCWSQKLVRGAGAEGVGVGTEGVGAGVGGVGAGAEGASGASGVSGVSGTFGPTGMLLV